MNSLLRKIVFGCILTLIALYCYTQKTKLNLYYANFFYHLGNECVEQCSVQKRLYYFQKAIKYNPLLKQGYYEIGRTFDDLGQYEKALQNFQKAAQLDYRYNWAYFEVGRHLFEHGKPDDSLRYFLQSEQYERFYDELHYYLGQYYQYKQIFTGAQNHFSKAVKMNPDHVLAHHGLGMAEYELGNIEKVQQEIARLKALNRMDLAENLMELIEKK